MKLRCTDQKRDTTHRPYYNGFFRFNGERVYTCKQCGELRTQNQREVFEGEIRHIKHSEKLKVMKRHGFPENYTPPQDRDE